ncbi:hypothetical protein SAMN05216332_10845 [Nitrosospira briensis]|nr:hypothetical protein SAMN05216332_10845 [Nitrosospira briensis]
MPRHGAYFTPVASQYKDESRIGESQPAFSGWPEPYCRDARLRAASLAQLCKLPVKGCRLKKKYRANERRAKRGKAKCRRDQNCFDDSLTRGAELKLKPALIFNVPDKEAQVTGRQQRHMRFHISSSLLFYSQPVRRPSVINIRLSRPLFEIQGKQRECD